MSLFSFAPRAAAEPAELGLLTAADDDLIDAEAPAVAVAPPAPPARRAAAAAVAMALGAAVVWASGSQGAHPAAAGLQGLAVKEAAATLPYGWEAVVGVGGKTYYHHLPTGRWTWEAPARDEWDRPQPWAAAFSKAPLPEGWSQQKDRHDRVYYLNEETGETQWERPGNSPIAAASCKYTTHVSSAIPGENIDVAMGQTEESCKELCTSRPDCLAVEFGTGRDGGDDETAGVVYPKGWCSLQSSGTGVEAAKPGYLNMDVFVKGDCLSVDEAKAPAADDAAEPAPPAVLEQAPEESCLPPKVKNSTTKQCEAPTGPSLMTFYMYRAQSDEEHPLENANMADLPGVLSSLHRGVSAAAARPGNITRLLRYMVTMRNTKALYQATEKQFAPFVEFQDGTAAGKGKMWQDWGFVVGCKSMADSSYNYKSAAEFSLPGPCPDEPTQHKLPTCMTQSPGGACPDSMVTGAEDCTYYAEFAGQLRLADIEGGAAADFWASPGDEAACAQRVVAVQALFKKTSPDLPATLPEPPCDA